MVTSKKDYIAELFYDNPTKHWHFEEIIKEANITRSKGDKWLKRLIKERLIKRIKKKGEMPFYISNYECPDYKYKKKIFALKKLYDSGFLNHLYSLKKAKTIILFGSFSKSDWYKNSDIDVFIYGSPEDLFAGKYEIKLQRDIQLFVCENKNDLRKIKHMMSSIIKGDLIKGDINFLKVGLNA